MGCTTESGRQIEGYMIMVIQDLMHVLHKSNNSSSAYLYVYAVTIYRAYLIGADHFSFGSTLEMNRFVRDHYLWNFYHDA